jgi:hypothetical protein
MLPLLVLGVLALWPGVAFADAHTCVAPGGGGDDTAVLQAALDRCSGARRSCTVRLCAGVFETGILRVRDFRGTLRGAGEARTVLRALPDLQVSTMAPHFFLGDPFDPTQPWPYLVQFIEGEADISDFGIEIPAPPDPLRPTSGWHLLDGDFSELRGALLLTGRRRVDFDVSRVRVKAAAWGDLGTTTHEGIEFGGLLPDPAADPAGFPVFPVRGEYSVTDSEFEGVLSGTPLSELAEATALVAHNRYRATVAVDVIDADRSRITVAANHWDVSYRGVQVQQNVDGAPSRRAGILVRDNVGTLEPLAAGLGDGLSFQDPIDASPEPGETVLWATENRFTLAGPAGPAASGMTVRGASGLRLSGNRISGRASLGLDVDDADACRILRNSLAGLDTGGGPDLRLGSSTSDCLAVVAGPDVVEDAGVANRIVRR